MEASNDKALKRWADHVRSLSSEEEVERHFYMPLQEEGAEKIDPQVARTLVLEEANRLSDFLLQDILELMPFAWVALGRNKKLTSSQVRRFVEHFVTEICRLPGTNVKRAKVAEEALPELLSGRKRADFRKGVDVLLSRLEEGEAESFAVMSGGAEKVAWALVAQKDVKEEQLLRIVKAGESYIKDDLARAIIAHPNSSRQVVSTIIKNCEGPGWVLRNMENAMDVEELKKRTWLLDLVWNAGGVSGRWQVVRLGSEALRPYFKTWCDKHPEEVLHGWEFLMKSTSLLGEREIQQIIMSSTSRELRLKAIDYLGRRAEEVMGEELQAAGDKRCR